MRRKKYDEDTIDSKQLQGNLHCNLAKERESMGKKCMSKKLNGDEAILLPLVNKSKIRDIICELDSVFLRSVANRNGFDGLVNKIADNAVVVAAYLDGVVVGFCAFYMNDFVSCTAYITLIAVKAECQNIRIGTMLIQYVKAAACVNGFRKIRLEVDRENTDGIRFYERNLFEVESRASDDSDYMVCVL